MITKTFFTAALVGLSCIPHAEELFSNGGFEDDSFSNYIVKSAKVSFVKTAYGRSLFLGTPTSGIEVEPLSDAVFPGKNDLSLKSFPHCSFALKLIPKNQYELSFDYMSGNIRNGGEFAITDSNGNDIRKRTMTVNNLDWNHIAVPFLTDDTGTTTITFRIASPSDWGGMAVDNVSVRILGDLLPRWGTGNVVFGDGELPGWFWQINSMAAVSIDSKGLDVETTAKETLSVMVKTPSVMPGREYCLRLGGKGNKPIETVALLRMLDATKRQIGEPLTFHLTSNADRQFMYNWLFTIPPTTMLVELTVKYSLDDKTTASLDTPRIFAALKHK